jgi:hypothetical protein
VGIIVLAGVRGMVLSSFPLLPEPVNASAIDPISGRRLGFQLTLESISQLSTRQYSSFASGYDSDISSVTSWNDLLLSDAERREWEQATGLAVLTPTLNSSGVLTFPHSGWNRTSYAVMRLFTTDTDYLGYDFLQFEYAGLVQRAFESLEPQASSPRVLRTAHGVGLTVARGLRINEVGFSRQVLKERAAALEALAARGLSAEEERAQRAALAETERELIRARALGVSVVSISMRGVYKQLPALFPEARHMAITLWDVTDETEIFSGSSWHTASASYVPPNATEYDVLETSSVLSGESPVFGAAPHSFSFGTRRYKVSCTPLLGTIASSYVPLAVCLVCLLLAAVLCSLADVMLSRRRAQLKAVNLNRMLKMKRTAWQMAREARNEAETANQSKSAFLAYLCHEVSPGVRF